MAENMFSILLKAILDENASAAEIKRQIDNLSKKASDVQLGVKIDDKEIERLRREIADIQKSLENDNLTTKERSRLLKEMNQLQRTLNTESRAYNQQNKQDLAHQRTQLSAIASAQKDAVSLRRSQQQLAKMENAEIEKENNNLREQKSLLSSMKTWHSKQTVGSMAQTGLFGVNDVGELRTAQNAYDQLISQIESGNISLKDARTEFQLLKDGITQLGDTVKKVDEIQHSLDTEKYSKDIKGISDELAKVGKFTLSDKTNADIFDKAQKSAESLESTYNQLKSTMVDVNATDQQKIDIENKYQQELITTKNLLSQINLSKDDEKISVGDNKRVNMIATLNSYLAKNTAMTKENKKQIEDWIAKLGSSDDMTVGAIKHINSEFKQLDATLRKTGKLGLSMWDKFKQAAEKFGGWSLVTGAITKVTSEVGKAVNELIELDNILTEISKTSDLTEQQLKKLGDTAFDTASKYGKTASDYLTGVQEMYRAGFDNAEEMAELSVLAQSAGDMDTTIANDYLLATNAAYKYKGSVEKLNKVLDSQNYITNNAAISMKDIADATTETASVAAQYGVQIDELSALIATATANTRESGSEVGTALKAIMINLQDTTSKPVTETFDELGISMTKVVNGAETLKTPIELIYELADAYNNLPEGDIMRANILNEIGQKRHANTLASILSDMGGYNDMLELYNSNLADDSAFREAEKSANNLSGSLNRLSNTWTDTVENILNSETLKGGIDFLNGALTLVNKLTESLGTLGTIALGGSIFAGIKNVGKPKMYGFVKYADNYKCSLGY